MYSLVHKHKIKELKWKDMHEHVHAELHIKQQQQLYPMYTQILTVLKSNVCVFLKDKENPDFS